MTLGLLVGAHQVSTIFLLESMRFIIAERTNLDTLTWSLTKMPAGYRSCDWDSLVRPKSGGNTIKDEVMASCWMQLVVSGV